MKKRLSIAFLALLVFPFSAAAQNPQSLPMPQGPVNDFAQVLDPATKNRLETKLTETERKAGPALVVVTVQNLDGMSVEEYAVRLFKRYGIGHKGKDDGVLLLLALKERKVRIEVGYGLEGRLTDGRSGDIIRQYALPNFREQKWATGLEQTSAGILDFLSKSEPTPPAVEAPGSKPEPILVFLMVVLAFGFVAIVVFFATRSPSEEEIREPLPTYRSVSPRRSRTTSQRSSSYSSSSRSAPRSEEYSSSPVSYPDTSSSQSSSSDSFGGFDGGSSGGGGASGSF